MYPGLVSNVFRKTFRKEYTYPMRTNQRNKAGKIVQISRPKNGRPSSYRIEYAEKAYKLCKEKGYNKTELARFFGVGRSTVCGWVNAFPDFCDALKNGMYEFNTKKVVRTLLERALGYTYTEVHEEFISIDGERFVESKGQGGRNGHGAKGKLIKGVKTRLIHKRVAPSDILLMYWLQNRAPDEWKNVQRSVVETTGTLKHEHEGTLGLEGLDTDELKRLRSILKTARDNAGTDTNSGGSGRRTGVSLAPRVCSATLAIHRN